jgi:hypothetical protein
VTFRLDGRLLGSVDDWQFARLLPQSIGRYLPCSYPVATGGRSPLGICKFHRSYSVVFVCSGPGPGEFRGERWKSVSSGIGLAEAAEPSHPSGVRSVTNSSVLYSTVGHPRRTIVTWLILPVVICLSQRLSHACLSISNYTAKLRMAHYISYRLFDNTLLLG